MDESLRRAIASELHEEPSALAAQRELASIESWDSLAALSVAVILGDALGLKVSPAEMFKLRTIGDLEALVAQLEGRATTGATPWRKLVAAGLAAAAPRGDAADAAVRLLAASGALDADSLIFVADQLDASALPVLDAFGSPGARVVAAQLRALAGDLDAAIATLDTALELPDAALLALRATWLVRRGRLAEAATDLRLALALHPPHAWFARHGRVLTQVIDSDAWEPRRSCRVAVLASSTTSTLVPIVRAQLFRDGVRASIYEASYGNFRQEILDPESGLYDARPDVVAVLTNHRDLALPVLDGEPVARAFADEMAGLWRMLHERRPCHIIHALVDAPADGSGGSLEDSARGRRRAIAACNERLVELAPAGVSLVEPGPGSRADWDETKQHPAPAAMPELASAIAAHVRAVLGLTAKVLVTDLDNTLWGGVIGEDGVGGIAIGPPSARGEGFAELQRYCKELKDRGILLAVASKNNPADAEEPFRTHDAMVLRMDDFVAFQASWTEKAAAIQAIAEELSLGLDSFVFLDDNPLERAWVRRQLPQVTVPEVGDDPWSMRAELARGRYFEALTVTAEDLERSSSYRATSAIKAASASSATLEEFLVGLQMTVEHGPFDELTLPRITQLLNKTNQFNVTTRRMTIEQLRRLASSPTAWCRWYRVADRFGDHGLVGVVIATAAGDTWTIDSWLMSCRVLGRRVEHFMCATALAAAREAGAARVIGEYVPTAKNELVRELFPTMSFAPLDEQGATRRYVFELAKQTAPTAPWIHGVAR